MGFTVKHKPPRTKKAPEAGEASGAGPVIVGGWTLDQGDRNKAGRGSVRPAWCVRRAAELRSPI